MFLLVDEKLLERALAEAPEGNAAAVGPLAGSPAVAAGKAGRAVKRLATVDDAAAAGPFAVMIAPRPSLLGPVPPFVHGLDELLLSGGFAVVSDVVWSTAPTKALMDAFLPPSGGDRVKPMEGYDMLLEHAGLHVEAHADAGAQAWDGLEEAPADLVARLRAERDAVAADERGAGLLRTWLLRRP